VIRAEKHANNMLIILFRGDWCRMVESIQRLYWESRNHVVV